MAKLNKNCLVDGTAYSYCPSCNYKEPTYKQLVCSENCYKIWDALSHHGVGFWSAQQTLDTLSNITMPSTLQPGIQAHIDRLWEEIEIAPKTVVEEVIPVVVIEDEPVVVEPIVAPRKKKNRPPVFVQE